MPIAILVAGSAAQLVCWREARHAPEQDPYDSGVLLWSWALSVVVAFFVARASPPLAFVSAGALVLPVLGTAGIVVVARGGLSGGLGVVSLVWSIGVVGLIALAADAGRRSVRR